MWCVVNTSTDTFSRGRWQRDGCWSKDFWEPLRKAHPGFPRLKPRVSLAPSDENSAGHA